MIARTPTTHFLTCGAAEGSTHPSALDAARLAAGLGHVNIIPIAAIIPPQCQLTEPRLLRGGCLVPADWAAVTSDIPGEVISAGIAAAYPSDPTQPGVIAHHAASGHKEDVEAMVRRMVQESMRIRGTDIRDIRSIAVQHRVEQLGAVFVAAVFRDLK